MSDDWEIQWCKYTLFRKKQHSIAIDFSQCVSFLRVFDSGLLLPKLEGSRRQRQMSQNTLQPVHALQVIFGEFLLYFWTLFESGETKLTQFNVFIFILCSLEMCRLIVSDIITASCTTQRVERIGQYMSGVWCQACVDCLPCFREVDCCGGHLPVSAQLQWGDAGLRRLHQLLRVQTQEDLGADQQDGQSPGSPLLQY